MATDNVTLKNLGQKIFDSMKSSLGSKSTAVSQYIKDESEQLAITLRMIIESCNAGEISEAEAKILLNQQKLATTAVLTTAEGMSTIAVQEALNAALKALKDFANSKIGFPLL